MKHKGVLIPILSLLIFACSKSSAPATPVPVITPVNINSIFINDISFDNIVYGAKVLPLIKVLFSQPIRQNTAAGAISLTDANGLVLSANVIFQDNNSSLVIQPSVPLQYLFRYSLKITTALQSASGGSLTNELDKTFITQIDSTTKFPVISDSALLDKVQQQTFTYFWDFGHPVSGMARERNSSGDLVTTGGTGFGIMAIVTAVNRHFITRADGAARVLLITSFLNDKCTLYHGAFAHWINGATGATIPFSTNDDGADIVETSYLMQGLITARQYFNTADITETTLRDKINVLWNGVDWSWFRQGGQNVLYWHWSPANAWIINATVSGWNEALITYVMAASSLTHSIPKAVYDSGWARNGGMQNNKLYYGYALPLGPELGGPLFFEHYSFMGINPVGLTDSYADYQIQTINHTKINYEYCKANPQQFYGYSSLCWGLTASDIPSGYSASSPTNDLGVIAPTAAISSLPYTPIESMAALKFYYYVLGDKLFKQYGFVDAFSLKALWFADSFLAIDQGPEIVMIENYRSGLLWKLFTSAPEIKTGMKNLGFTAPYL